MKLFKDRKGQMSNQVLGLITLGVILVAFAVSLTIGQNIVTTIKEAEFTGNSTEWNATEDTQIGMQTLTGQTNNIALIAILTVIIALLFGALGFIIARGKSDGGGGGISFR